MAEKRKWIKYKQYKVAKLDDYERVSGPAKTIIDIVIRKKIPITEEEKAIAEDIRQAIAKGYFIDLPLE